MQPLSLLSRSSTLLLLIILPLAACETEPAEPAADETIAETAPVEAIDDGTVYGVVAQDPRLTTFAALLDRVAPELRDAEGAFTLFAPTNEAFAQIDQASRGSWLETDNEELLRSIVDHHIVQGRYTAADLSSAAMISTVNNETLDIDQIDAANLEVNGATVIEADRTASNGVVHVIDSVMDPAVQYILRDTQ